MKQYMKKIELTVACIQDTVIAYTAPVCVGIIFMNITGHGKGYGYDLGSEKDISIMFGAFELIIWLLPVVPNSIFLFRKMRSLGHKYVPVMLWNIAAYPP